MNNNITTTIFQEYCEKVINKLTEECIENFRVTKDEDTRVKLLYEAALSIPINFIQNNGKDFQAAQVEKVKGNAFFAKKDYSNALQTYSRGICICPQATREYLFKIFLSCSVLSELSKLTYYGEFVLHLV